MFQRLRKTTFSPRSKPRAFLSSLLHTARIILRNAQARKYEPEILHLHRFINLGDVCLHVGASDGRHTVVMARLAGTGPIYCFEPSIYTLRILNRVLRFHGIKNVNTYNIAMSDHRGETNLITPIKLNGHIGRSFAFLSDAIPDLNFLRENKGFIDMIVEPVQVQTVDGFCEEQEIDTVDFIRCDVEGAELSVLSGSAQIIGKCRPILLLEVHPYSLRDHFDSTAEGLFKLLASWNYKSFYINRNTLIETQFFFEEEWRDYFCVPEEKVPAKLN